MIFIIIFLSPWIYDVVEPVVIIWFVKFDEIVVAAADDDDDDNDDEEEDEDDDSDEKDGIWNAAQ